MSQYQILIKNKMIDFDKLLLETYYQIGLDETETIILIKINSLLNTDKVLDTKKIANIMNLNEKEVSKKVVELVEKGYISLSLDDNGEEVASIEETYNRLANILEREDEVKLKEGKRNVVKEVVALISSSFNKIPSSIELELINHWVLEDKYSYDRIEEAVLDCLKRKKNSVKYVDCYLNETKVETNKNIDYSLQEKFNNVFKKIK